MAYTRSGERLLKSLRESVTSPELYQEWIGKLEGELLRHRGYLKKLIENRLQKSKEHIKRIDRALLDTNDELVCPSFHKYEELIAEWNLTVNTLKWVQQHIEGIETTRLTIEKPSDITRPAMINRNFFEGLDDD